MILDAFFPIRQFLSFFFSYAGYFIMRTSLQFIKFNADHSECTFTYSSVLFRVTWIYSAGIKQVSTVYLLSNTARYSNVVVILTWTYRVTICIASQNNSRSAFTRIECASVFYLWMIPQLIGVIFHILTGSLVQFHVVLPRCEWTIVRSLMAMLVSFYSTNIITVFIFGRCSLR